MSNLAIAGIIILIIAIILGNLILIKKSAKLGLRDKKGSKSTKSTHHPRPDNNARWDDDQDNW